MERYRLFIKLKQNVCKVPRNCLLTYSHNCFQAAKSWLTRWEQISTVLFAFMTGFQATLSQALLSYDWTCVCLYVGFAQQVAGFPGSLSSLASTFFFCLRLCQTLHAAGALLVGVSSSVVVVWVLNVEKKRSNGNALTLYGQESKRRHDELCVFLVK